MGTDYQYTGTDNLEVMEGAVNYNAYQRDFILANMDAVGPGPHTVLDLGAGIGTYSDMVREARPDTVIECVEPTPAQAMILRKKGYKVYASIEETTKSYDVVFSLNVLEHLEADAALLRQAGQGIRVGGRVVIYVPALMMLWTQLDVHAEHFRRYRRKDMFRLANEAELRIRGARYIDPIGGLLAIGYRFIGGSGDLNPRSIWIFDRILFPVGVLLQRITGRFFGKNLLAIYER